MDDCIFCKIGKKEIAVKAILQNEKAVSFLDINPVSPGHSVVIPKSHFSHIEDMNDEDISFLFILVRETTKKIASAIKCDGFNIGINQGKAAGWGVPHIHVHIIPRFEGDGGGSMHTIVRNPPKESIDEIYNKIISDSKEIKKIPLDWELDL